MIIAGFDVIPHRVLQDRIRTYGNPVALDPTVHVVGIGAIQDGTPAVASARYAGWPKDVARLAKFPPLPGVLSKDALRWRPAVRTTLHIIVKRHGIQRHNVYPGAKGLVRIAGYIFHRGRFDSHAHESVRVQALNSDPIALSATGQRAQRGTGNVAIQLEIRQLQAGHDFTESHLHRELRFGSGIERDGARGTLDREHVAGRGDGVGFRLHGQQHGLTVGQLLFAVERVFTKEEAINTLNPNRGTASGAIATRGIDIEVLVYDVVILKETRRFPDQDLERNPEARILFMRHVEPCHDPEALRRGTDAADADA